MNKLVLTDWLAIVSALGVIVALISNVASMRSKSQDKVIEVTEIKADIKHIREKVDKNDTVTSGIDNKIDDMDKRLVVAEESVKSAHHRIDGLEKKG